MQQQVRVTIAVRARPGSRVDPPECPSRNDPAAADDCTTSREHPPAHRPHQLLRAATIMLAGLLLLLLWLLAWLALRRC